MDVDFGSVVEGAKRLDEEQKKEATKQLKQKVVEIVRGPTISHESLIAVIKPFANRMGMLLAETLDLVEKFNNKFKKRVRLADDIHAAEGAPKLLKVIGGKIDSENESFARRVAEHDEVMRGLQGQAATQQQLITASESAKRALAFDKTLMSEDLLGEIRRREDEISQLHRELKVDGERVGRQQMLISESESELYNCGLTSPNEVLRGRMEGYRAYLIKLQDIVEPKLARVKELEREIEDLRRKSLDPEVF